MADLTAVRAAAWQLRTLAGIENSGTDLFLPAQEVLNRCLDAAGLMCIPMPAGDPLLHGALGIYDPEMSAVWLQDSLPPSTAHFTIAHEIGHARLHGESEGASDTAFCTNDRTVGSVRDYSPAQRIEVEANQFAAELLLPLPAAQQLLLTHADTTEAARSLQIPAFTIDLQMRALLAEPLRPPADTQATAVSGGLDASQTAAAEIRGRPALISAGPGTGKTRTLVERARLLVESGINPSGILALTFSNRAAEEMRERLAAWNREAASRMWIGTFHAFGLDILRRFGEGAPPTLLEPVAASELLEELLLELPLLSTDPHQRTFHTSMEILKAVSRCRDELLSPEELQLWAQEECRRLRDAGAEKDNQKADRLQDFAAVFAAWDQHLRTLNALEFGDLVSRAVELLRNNHAVVQYLRRTYAEVLVDEFQDVNHAGAELVHLIAGEGSGLWVVGDTRQAIYRFRGASPRNITQFLQRWPHGIRMELDTNYRSGVVLTDGFSRAAKALDQVETEFRWYPHRAVEGSVSIVNTSGVHDEADLIEQEVRMHVGAGGLPGDIAVLVATNKQLTALAEELDRRGIRTQTSGYVWEQEPVRNTLAVVALLADSAGNELYRAASALGVPMEMSVCAEVVRWAQSNSVSWREAAAVLHERDTDRFAPLLELMGRLQQLPQDTGLQGILHAVLFGESDMARQLLLDNTPQGEMHRAAVHQLLAIAGQWEQSPVAKRHDPLSGFLRHVRRRIGMSAHDRILLPPHAAGSDALHLMTVHAAKGLEFHTVLLCSVAKGEFVLPEREDHYPLPDDGDEEETRLTESRRLLFVGITRARDRLVVAVRPYETSKGAKNPALESLIAIVQTSFPTVPVRDFRRLPTAEPLHHAPSDQQSQYFLHELTVYDKCPRRYWYETKLGLNNNAHPQPWDAAHSLLREYMQRADGLFAAAGGTPNTADLFTDFQCAMEQALAGLRGKAGRIARDTAYLRRYCELRREGPSTKAHFDVGGHAVIVPIDQQFERDGRIVCRQILRGKTRDRSGELPYAGMIAATRHDDRNRVYEYAGLDGAEPIAKNPRSTTVDAKVARMAAAIEGIENGRFEARQSENCAFCPFLFLCPAG
jgi:superfamily I DNA/RNA helicase